MVVATAAPPAAPTDARTAPAPAADEYLYLTGRPRLRDLVRFARRHAPTPPDEKAPHDPRHPAPARRDRGRRQERGGGGPARPPADAAAGAGVRVSAARVARRPAGAERLQ